MSSEEFAGLELFAFVRSICSEFIARYLTFRFVGLLTKEDLEILTRESSPPNSFLLTFKWMMNCHVKCWYFNNRFWKHLHDKDKRILSKVIKIQAVSTALFHSYWNKCSKELHPLLEEIKNILKETEKQKEELKQNFKEEPSREEDNVDQKIVLAVKLLLCVEQNPKVKSLFIWMLSTGQE